MKKMDGMNYSEYVEWAMEFFDITEDEAMLYADDVFGLTEVEK